jgi:hypothetical protein
MKWAVGVTLAQNLLAFMRSWVQSTSPKMGVYQVTASSDVLLHSRVTIDNNNTYSVFFRKDFEYYHCTEIINV